ncbi:MAG: complex I subunit 1 family protein [Acidimicrobiales bacterium]
MTVLGIVVQVAAMLIGGAYVLAVADRLIGGSAPNVRSALTYPIERLSFLMVQPVTTTERPDFAVWILAPALLAGLAAVGAVAVPIGGPSAAGDISAGLVLFGAAMLIVLVAVFIFGWAPNSVFPMIGGYRFAAMVLSVGIPFSLVVLTTAIPAESLSVGTIVESQSGLWYVLVQPLGFVIYLVTAAAMAFWGPFDLPEGADLAGGVTVEASGPRLAMWRFAQAALMVTLSLMGAAIFLGGYLGPVLPGWLWTVLKAAVLLIVLAASGRTIARMRVQRFVWFGWVVLLPLALVDVFVSGAVAL